MLKVPVLAIEYGSEIIHTPLCPLCNVLGRKNFLCLKNENSDPNHDNPICKDHGEIPRSLLDI
jgi:hypothetical protein